MVFYCVLEVLPLLSERIEGGIALSRRSAFWILIVLMIVGFLLCLRSFAAFERSKSAEKSPLNRRGGSRVSENLRIHFAIEKHSFGGRRKVTIRGSVAPKNDVLSFLPRRLFFYRVYWRSFSKAHTADVGK